jgi:tRNA nucleotidyltransferase/poly(A) polymerase
MTILLPAHKIEPPKWMQDPDLIRVLDTLNDDDINARMVGGCIRNHYMNKNIYDIDIACKYTPEKSIKILNSNNIKTIPTGIKHGTITVNIDGKNFEITTLRRDTNTDGRHTEVVFSDNWHEDAQRRDFTINALYADRDGSIYDPLNTGINDLQSNIVRFIGDAEQRIQEDHLRILRFFRFFAEYGTNTPDEKSFNACVKYKHTISELSDERITDELYKILSKDSVPRAIEAMEKCGLFDLTPDTPHNLSELIASQVQLKVININSRFYTTKISKKYIKNNKIKLFFKSLNTFKKQWKNNIKESLYRFDRDIVTQGLLILKSQGHTIDDIQISDAMNTPIPDLPITATDIMDHFKIPQGIEIGKKLKKADAIWIESNFTLTLDQILEKI